MLSRVADSIYWMNRYIERADNVARFIDVNLHLMLDLSVVPSNYLEFASLYPVAVNGRLADIRKSHVSANLTAPGDGWDGPVIVKSNLNYRGLPEQVLEGNWAERRWLSAKRREHLQPRQNHAPFPI